MKRTALLTAAVLLVGTPALAAPLDLNGAAEQALYDLIARQAYTSRGRAVNAKYCRDNARRIVAGRPYAAVSDLVARKIVSATLYGALKAHLLVDSNSGSGGTAPPTPGLPFPKTMDLTATQSPVRNQARRNTCMAFSTTAGMESFDRTLDLSEQLLYHLLRESDSDRRKCEKLKYDPAKPNECDDKCSGATAEAAVKVLQRVGLFKESDWPYRPTDNLTPGVSCHEFATWASEAVRPEGRPRVKLGRVVWLAEPGASPRSKRVDDPMVLMAILAQGTAVNVFVDVAGSGWNSGRMIDVERDPRTKRPLKSEGSHGILLVGYDYDRKLLKFKNSWDSDWGEDGYGWMTFDYLKTYVYGGYYATGIAR
jgi:hypothetical protein